MQSLLRGAQVYYSVGAGSVNASNAHFVKGGDKALIARMRGKGWKVHSIVGCGSITTLRSLFADPQPFISGAIENAVELGLDGERPPAHQPTYPPAHQPAQPARHSRSQWPPIAPASK